MGWLLGWAVPSPWFEAEARAIFPGAEHVFVRPAPGALAQLQAAGPFDWVVGYSLGALLLLADPAGAEKALERGEGKAHGRVALLAPFFSLLEEAGGGGRVRRTQLQFMTRRLRRDPTATVADFYARAGLNVPPGLPLPDTLENLLWGLDRLELAGPAPALPHGWRAWCGESDALLDAGRLRELARGVSVVPGGSHHPRALAQAFAAELAASGMGPSLAASFSRAAVRYLKHARAQTAMAQWLAEWVPLDRSGRALEIGAGPGVFTRHLLPWPGDLTASDFSPAMCAVGQAQWPQVRWESMRAEAPAAGPWDWIFSSSVLQWVADPRKVFATWRDRLAPGGRILGGLFAAGSLPEWTAVAGELAPLRWRAPAEWREQLQAAGLTLVRDESVRRSYHHPTALDFLRSLHHVGAAPLRRTSPARLRRLLREYEARYRVGPAGVAASWVLYRFEARLA